LDISHGVKEDTRNVIQLKTNKIPPGLSPLEPMLDSNYALVSPPKVDSQSNCKVKETISINLGTEEDPHLFM
jgi:hypothetical protein